MSDSELSPELAGELQRISRQLADEVLAEAAAVSADPTLQSAPRPSGRHGWP